MREMGDMPEDTPEERQEDLAKKIVKKKVGRPCKLTPAVQETIVEHIRHGNYFSVAAGAAGIDYNTFRRWMAMGEVAKSGKYKDFFVAVTRAEDEMEAHLVETIEAQVPKDWRAGVALLERRQRNRWASKVTQEISGPGGGPIPVASAKVDSERLIKIARDLAAAAGPEVPKETEGQKQGA